MKILMVCLGNICRSPLAEGIMKHKVIAAGLDWQIDSAGTSSFHVGELPDSRSIQIARKYGIDITDQRARQFQRADLDEYDLVLTMDSSNYQKVKNAATRFSKAEIEMIMNFERPGFNENVPDPYWDDNGFEQVYQMLDKACDAIIERYADGFKP